jgi:hypothetical protein
MVSSMKEAERKSRVEMKSQGFGAEREREGD